MITIVKSVWSSPYVDCEGDVYVRFRTDGIVNNWIALSRHPKHAPFTWYDNNDETNDASYNNDANDNDDPKHAALPWYNDHLKFSLYFIYLSKKGMVFGNLSNLTIWQKFRIVCFTIYWHKSSFPVAIFPSSTTIWYELWFGFGTIYWQKFRIGLLLSSTVAIFSFSPFGMKPLRSPPSSDCSIKFSCGNV